MIDWKGWNQEVKCNSHGAGSVMVCSKCGTHENGRGGGQEGSGEEFVL